MSLDLNLVKEKLERKGFTEYALTLIENNIEQIRFSQNLIDLSNIWNEQRINVFAANGNKVATTIMRDMNDDNIDKLWKAVNASPGDKLFSGLNTERQNYHGNNSKFFEYDLQDFSKSAIQSALDSGAERVAGTAYNISTNVKSMTRYNECEYKTGGIELNIRSFKGEFSGQEGIHWGLSSGVNKSSFERAGSESAGTAIATGKKENINPGKYTVIMSPYVIGNIVSSSIGSLSYYAIEAGMSNFKDEMGNRVAGDQVSLIDDPLDSSGVGYRLADDECTGTRKNEIIKNGILKTYLHSYSTATRSGTKTTGNAGIIKPTAWQPKLLPGIDKLSDMIAGLKDGLLIENCWYTRFQDYKNGIFSTVPRDGVFLIHNGEINGNVAGIRISDSFRNILSNIEEVSSESKNAKWWQEVAATNMPYVKAKGVNISRAF
ncbi:MAG: TldD/PmbA family protein [Ferroplasma sp.]